MKSRKELNIAGIREGTVIDHIKTENTFKVADFLGLKKESNVVTIGLNLESKKLGRKGLVKVGNRLLTKSEVDKLALVAPNANVNIIKDYEVRNKFKVEVPSKIVGLLKCANHNCITNKEDVNTRFRVVSKDPLKVRCEYCERVMEREDIEIA